MIAACANFSCGPLSWSSGRPLVLCRARVRWRCQEDVSFASSGVLDMEDAAWLLIPGPYVSGGRSPSQLCPPPPPPSPLALLYEGVSSAPKAFKAAELPSAGRARVGSPDVCRPAHLRCSGVGVHLGETQGHRCRLKSHYF